MGTRHIPGHTISLYDEADPSGESLYLFQSDGVPRIGDTLHYETTKPDGAQYVITGVVVDVQWCYFDRYDAVKDRAHTLQEIHIYLRR